MARRGAWVAAIAVACALVRGAMGAQGLEAFGAVSGDSSHDAAWRNSWALRRALQAANATADRTLVVESGKDYTFYNFTVSGLVGVTLQLDGVLRISDNVTSSAWALQDNDGGGFGAMHFEDCVDLRMHGRGRVEGQGYRWWWHVILTAKDYRPHMLVVHRTRGLEITDLVFRNSPQFHMKLDDVRDVYIARVDIMVDLDKQREVLQGAGHWKPLSAVAEAVSGAVLDGGSWRERMVATLRRLGLGLHRGGGAARHLLGSGEALERFLETLGVPTFPLNTDGIDPSGQNVTIEDCRIQNYDDAVAVKPANQGHTMSPCSQDMVIRNVQVAFGVGMTIGSVPPNTGVNCVKNILFENITFEHPIKAIYIKSNPGDHGSGVVRNVTYRHVRGVNPLWYPIWIGPQQQQQPGTAGTGCSFLYPIVHQCPTQPRVAIDDVVLDDVVFEGGLTLPGVLMGDPQQPYTGFEFRDVKNTGMWLVSMSYDSTNVRGVYSGSTYPQPDGFTKA